MRRLLGVLPPLEASGLALVVGWMTVAGLTHFLNLVPLEIVPGLHIPAWLTVTIALFFVVRWGRKGPPPRAIEYPSRERREARILAGATLATAILYLLQYDQDLFAFTCSHRAVAIAARTDVGALWDAASIPRLLLFDGENDMHGVVAVLALLPSMAGFFGVRLAYALLHACLASTSWVLVRRAGFRPQIAAAVFGVVALHPTFLSTPIDDVNHVALLVSLTLWTTIIVARRSSETERVSSQTAFFTGLLAALMVGAWHPFILSLPFLIALLPPGSRRAWLRTGTIGLLLGVLPFALRHQFGLGGLFVFESFAENAATTHSVAGLSLDYSGLLNWPFNSDWVRTPGNPLPTALLLPAWLLATSGALLAAIAALGSVALLKTKRSDGIVSILWILPGLFLLAPQENWFEIEKLQISTVWLAPLPLILAAGFHALPSRRGLLGFVALVTCLSIGIQQAAHLDIRPDQRLYEKWPHLRLEEDSEVQAFRQSLTQGSLLPRMDVLGPDPRTFGDRLAALGEAMAAPRYADRPTSLREVGLQLAIPEVWQLFLAPQRVPSQEVPASPEVSRALRIDLAEMTSVGPKVFEGVIPSENSLGARTVKGLLWAQATHVIAFQQRGAPQDIHLVVAGASPNMLKDLYRDLPEAKQLSLPELAPPEVNSIPWAVDGTEVTVGLPQGARLQITEIISIEPSRVRRWWVEENSVADPTGALPTQGPSFARYN